MSALGQATGRRARRRALATAGELVATGTALLAGVGCDTPRLDAELLVAAAAGLDRMAVVADPRRPLPTAVAERAWTLLARRAQREPLAYILGRKAFRRLELAVDRRVLIPRPESELLVDVAVAEPAGAHVHEVGCGSGAIALAIASERPDLRVTASDVSPAALAVARANAERLGVAVELWQADLLPRQLEGGCDLVVANLPYVSEREWERLAPEIRCYEPRTALVAGPRGSELIEMLLARCAPGQRVALEHAPWQAAAVRSWLERAHTLRDLAGYERVTVGRVPQRPTPDLQRQCDAGALSCEH